MSNKFDQARQVMDEAVQAALEAVGIVVEGQAIELAAIDTGRLKGSITYATKTAKSSPRPGPNYTPDERDGVTHDGSDNSVVIGTNVEYAPYVEYGTVHMAAQPFLRRAIEITRNDIEEVFATIIRSKLDGIK